MITQQDPYTLPAHGCMCEQAVECEELLHMIHHGMRVLPEGMTVQEVPAFSVNNYPECEAGRAAIRESIADEVRKGILRELPYAAQRASALFTKEEPGKRRVIRDYSKPAGASINDSADAMRFGMMGVQDAQDAMQPFWYMAKTDIKSAYRTVHVHPTHRELLCFKYSPADGEREVYYEDTRSPFGLKNAPETFCRLTAAVRAMMVARGFKHVIVYVDDFLVMAETREECKRALDALLEVLRELGFTTCPKKTEQPTQTIMFLGMRLCTNEDGHGKMTVTVPEDKLRKAEEMALLLHRRHTVTVSELQQAVGYFNYIATAIYSARCFMRRLIYAIRDADRARQHAIEVTQDIRLDLNFWVHYARNYNGQAVVLQKPLLMQGFLSTDASDWGMGGFFDGRWFSVKWSELSTAKVPREFRQYNKSTLWPNPADTQHGMWRIEYREMFAQYWGMMLWGQHMRGYSMLWHQDNTIAEGNMNRMGAKRPAFMRLLRAIFKMAAVENMRHRSTRITSEANVLSDTLSRGKMQEFSSALKRWQAENGPGACISAWERPTPRDPPLMEHRARRRMAGTAEASLQKTTPESAEEELHAMAETLWVPRYSE